MKYCFLSGTCLLLAGLTVYGQPTLSLKQAVVLVEQNQPRLRAFKEQATAAAQGVALAKSSALPELNAGYQANYATFNNISGMNYPGILMPMTGPPAASNSSALIPGSALAALAKWEPFSFGQRQAAVARASAQFQLANAGYSQELFRQQYAAAYTYINAVYLERLMDGLDANIRRVEAVLEQSLELARQGLKPGIDTVQFQGQLAQARAGRLNAQKEYEAQLTELTRLTGTDIPLSLLVLTDTLMAAGYPRQPDTAKTMEQHPVLDYYTSRTLLSKAGLEEVQKGWRPRLDIWGSAFARGSGVQANGSIDKSAGFALTRSNYGAGFQLSFPILGFMQTNLQKKQYRNLLQSDESLLAQARLDLQKQWQAAVLGYSRSREIAEQLQRQAEAASYAYEGLKLSYASGLIEYTRLAQGQYELVNAEAGRANAYVQVWKSLLDMAVARGDLNLLLEQLK